MLLRWPVAAGFGAYAFLVPFDSVALVADSGGSTLTRLFGIVAAGALLLSGIVQRRLVRPPRAAVAVALFIVWGVITLTWAVDFDLAQARVQTAVSLLAMYLVAVCFDVSRRELTTVCLLTILGGVIAAAAGVIFGFEEDTQQAVRGTLAVANQTANPNSVAQSLLLPLALAIAMFLRSRRFYDAAASAIGVAAIAGGILLTMSRTSLVAVAAMICVLLYRTTRSRIWVAVGIVGALLPAMPQLFFDRIDRVVSAEDLTGTGRTEIWKVGVQALEEFGVFGAGLSNFPAVYGIYAGGEWRGAHNTFLMTWVELGAVGLILFVVALVGHLLRLVPDSADSSYKGLVAAIKAACFGFMVVAVAGDVLWSKAFWMPWILVIWVSRLRPAPQVE
jgi:O-antigen ligase